MPSCTFIDFGSSPGVKPTVQLYSVGSGHSCEDPSLIARPRRSAAQLDHMRLRNLTEFVFLRGIKTDDITVQILQQRPIGVNNIASLTDE